MKNDESRNERAEGRGSTDCTANGEREGKREEEEEEASEGDKTSLSPSLSLSFGLVQYSTYSGSRE